MTKTSNDWRKPSRGAWANGATNVVDLRDYQAAVEEIERLHSATVIVGELAALIPLSETIEATRTGATMIQWFKEHLRPADEPTAAPTDPKRDEKLREVSQATIDAKLLGAGFLMIMPDNSFQRIDPEDITLKVRAPLRCLAMINEFGDKVCSLPESHGGPHVWVAPERTTVG